MLIFKYVLLIVWALMCGAIVTRSPVENAIQGAIVVFLCVTSFVGAAFLLGLMH